MKTIVLLAAMSSANAFAAEKSLVYNCSNDHYNVRLYEQPDYYRAVVTVTDDEDNSTTYRYAKLTMNHKGKRIGGGPLIFSNGHFRMSITHVQGTKARVEAPEDGISVVLPCR